MSLTYYDKKNPLVETCDFVPETISWESSEGKALTESEAKSDPKARMVLEGVFQRADVKNLNKRVYPRKVWEKQLSEKSPLMAKLRENRMYGHLEHPENGVTDLNKVAILIKGLNMDEKGVVRGKCTVLDTPSGRIVKECVEAGGSIGISSRGTGSVDAAGMVQEDYAAETWDIVYNPSTPGAHIAPPKTDETAEAAQATLSEGTNMELPAIPEGLEIDEDKAPLSSVEQDVLIHGPEFVKARTGISKPNDLGNVLLRFRKWAKQRGPADRTIEDAWASFIKVYPLVQGGGEGHKEKPPADAKTTTGVPATNPTITTHPAPSNTVPAITTIKSGVVDSKEPENKPAVDEAVVKLLEDAKNEIKTLTEAKVALETSVTTLTEQVSKMTKDAEAASAIVSNLQETAKSLKAKVEEQAVSLDRAVDQIAALTAYDNAVQVRESIQNAISNDKRLAPFKETLELCKTTAAVEAKSQEIVKTMTESVVTAPVVTTKLSLAERLVTRAKNAEEHNLPKPSVSLKTDEATMTSESDADNVIVETVTKPTTKHKAAAKLAVGMIKRINKDQGI
jgi:hypothetical protein